MHRLSCVSLADSTAFPQGVLETRTDNSPGADLGYRSRGKPSEN